MNVLPRACVGWPGASPARLRGRALGVALALLVGGGSPAHAQEVTPEGVVGEAPITAGNTAGARDRAMNEAFRQLVEQGLAALVAEGSAAPAPAALASLRAGWLQRPRRLVQTYRVLEEGEANGYFRVRLTAVLDDAFMRRELDRVRGGGARGGGTAALPLVATGSPQAALAVQSALASAGVALTPATETPQDEPNLRALAARSGRGAAVLVSGRVVSEGHVRGTGQQSVECHLGVRTVPAAAATPAPERAASARAFAAREGDARADCFARATAAVLPALLPDLGVAVGGSSDARVLALALDLTEPAALSPVLRGLRKIGGVTAVEVRRVQIGRVEVQVTTRLNADALVAALTRELAAVATLTRGEQQAGRLELRVRLLPPPEASAPPMPAGEAAGATAPAPPSGAGAGQGAPARPPSSPSVPSGRTP